MTQNLKEYINKIVRLTETEMNILTSLFFVKQLEKKTYFAIEGEFSKEFAFVSKGIFRAFYRNNEGIEYNKSFFIENNFLGAYSSLISRQKNLINIQCLTDCTLLVADYSKMVKLYDSYPKIERLARILAEYYFMAKEKREIELVMMDAGERYMIFQKEYQGLENLIPQYHIASYLGVTATQLSRIRAKK